MSKCSIISIENVEKDYDCRAMFFNIFYRKQHITVFKHLNCGIEEGEIVGVFGPNGSGKSTLLKLIASCYLPTRGRILVNGYDTYKHNSLTKRMMGVNFNNGRNFFWQLTGRQNINLITSMDGVSHTASYRKSLEELAAILEIEHRLDHYVGEYSSGMKEKLGYILSLLSQRRILVYDDFGKSLDSTSFLNLVRYLKRRIEEHFYKAIVVSSPRLGSIPFINKSLSIQNQKLIEIQK